MDYKQRILKTASQLFTKYGFRNVTVDEISREAGISKRTFYETFTNKDELVMAQTRQFLEEAEEDYHQIVQSSNNAIEENIEFMKRSMALYEKLAPRALIEMQRYHPNAWELIIKHREEFFLQQVMKNIKRGKAEKLYREEINEETVARMRMAQSQYLFDPVFFPPESTDIKKAGYEMMTHYIYGLCSPEGFEKASRLLALEGLDN